MIREIVIVSGKGGTGKTSICACLASLAENCVFCDGDVDAADLHLLMAPTIEKREPFMGGSLASIRSADCTSCGRCRELCRFDAISEDFNIDALSCEGCGVCVDLCPEKAIDFPVQQCGEWYCSDTRFGPMVHARLGIAEENSGKLVSLVRSQGRKLAEDEGYEMIVTDGPPGIGCPVIAAIGGATILLFIVEPTVSGIHDMQRLVELATHFKVPGQIIINKFDLNPELSDEIEAFAVSKNIQVLGRIPFDPIFIKAMVAGKTVMEAAPDSKVSQIIRRVWKKISAASATNALGLRDLSATIHS